MTLEQLYAMLSDAVDHNDAEGMAKYRKMIEEQSIKADDGKLRLTLVPLEAIEAIATVREYGVKKYGERESWRKVDAQRYRDAAFRHWIAYLRDPKGVDDESGIKHLWHCICNLAFLVTLEMEKEDDKTDV